MENNTQHLYVNMPEHTPCFETIGAALASVPWDCEKEEGGKNFPAPVLSIPNVIIHIGPGVYREKLVVERPCLTLKGEGARREDVVLVYGEGAGEIMPDGNKRGTFRTASVRIDAHDFTAEHLTFRNDAGFGHTVGQALALYVDADRCYFNDCALIASQDTLFTAPLPPKEVEPGGFRGPGQTKPRILGRHCYRNCYIQGDIDFIFGGGICWFEDCVIFSKMPGDMEPGGKTYGYITAASTPEGEKYGYVLKNCKLESDCAPHTIYLGRPWREFAKTVYLHCEMGSHIKPEGWHDWGKPHGHFYYGEYDSYGPGADPGSRADFSHQLTDAEAAEYTIENVLGGWTPE